MCNETHTNLLLIQFVRTAANPASRQTATEKRKSQMAVVTNTEQFSFDVILPQVKRQKSHGQKTCVMLSHCPSGL